jgi:Tfp pilus assembly protein PilX
MTASRRARRSSGSVFVIALLTMLALTFLALSLSVVTSTEAALGANDRMLQRTFYAADTGLAVIAARYLVKSDSYGPAASIPLPPADLPVLVPEIVGAVLDNTNQAVTLVTTSFARTRNTAPAAYSEVNRRGTASSKAMDATTIGFTAWGYRWNGSQQTAQRVTASTLTVQPVERKPEDMLDLAGDPAGIRPPIDDM